MPPFDAIRGDVSRLEPETGIAFDGVIGSNFDTDWLRGYTPSGIGGGAWPVAPSPSSAFPARLTFAAGDGGAGLYSRIEASKPAFPILLSASGDGSAILMSTACNCGGNVTPVDTIPNNTSTTATIEVNGIATGMLESSIDEDWFAVQLVAGQVYDVRLGSTNGDMYDPDLVIYDSAGNFYASLDDGNPGQTRFLFQAEYTGTYYIGASVWPGPLGRPGGYQITLNYEHAQTTDTLTTLHENERLHTEIQYIGDLDWFGVDLQAGVTYEFRTWEDPNEFLSLYNEINLYGADGILIVADNNHGDSESIIYFTPTVSGRYFLEVMGSGDTPSGLYGHYGVTYEVVPYFDDTIAGDATTTASVAVGGSFTSTMEYRNDHDWIAVHLEAGQAYYVSMVASDPDNLLQQPDFLIRSADGTIHYRDDWVYVSETGHLIGFVADVTGTYYIDATLRHPDMRGEIILSGTPGEYTVTVNEEINGDVDTSATIAVGETATSILDFWGDRGVERDRDWFRMELTAGETYYFEIGPDDDASNLLFPDLGIRDANGAVVYNPIFDDSWDNDSQISFLVFTATTTGTYYLDVSTYGGGQQFGTGYSVSMQSINLATDAYSANTSTTGVLTTGAPVTSAINFGTDEDWFAINVVQGQYYTVTLTGAGPNPLEDLNLSIRVSGSYAGSDRNEGGSATVTFQAETTGTLHVAVAPQTRGDTGGYTLTMTSSSTSPDTIANDLTSTTFLQLDTPTQSAIDYVYDQDVFRVSLTAGQSYMARVTASEIDEYENAGFIVELYRPNGALVYHTLGATSYNDISMAPFTATETGDYYVRIRNQGSYNTGYTVSVDTVDPTDTLSVGGPRQPHADGVFRLYFAPLGEDLHMVVGSEYSVGWSQEQIDTIMAAWSTFMQYIDIDVEITTDRSQADFIHVMVPNSGLNDNPQGVGPYGSAPERNDIWLFQQDGDVFGEEFGGGAPGTPGFAYMLNMIGNVLGLRSTYGLANDVGGGLVGVDSMYGSYGSNLLNQGVFTLMSTNTGWATGFLELCGVVPDPGAQATPMALDFAVLQLLYGANTTANAGATVYNLPVAGNGSWRLIWDTGGNDTIAADPTHTEGVVIDLRGATLNYSTGGGGFVSYSGGIAGGFTIANGVVIENATGGAGNDTFHGNSASNVINGGAGSDTLIADGDPTGVTIHLIGGWGQDGWGNYDTLIGLENAVGSAFNDTLVGTNTANSLIGGGGDDWIVGLDGDDVMEGGAGINVLIGGAGTDLASYASQTANLWIDMPAGVYSAVGVWDVFWDSIDGVLGGSGNDSIFGNASNNTLIGGAGDDALIGNAGNDRLEGRAGFDWIVGGDGNDRLIGGTNDVDVLTGGTGADVFDLGTAAGWDVAFDFNAAEDRFSLGGLQWLGFLTYDADGDGQADDTLLGYAGGNFVALNVSGLTLAQWNALIIPAGAEVDADKALYDPDPEVLPATPSPDGKAFDDPDPEVRPLRPGDEAIFDRHAFGRDFVWNDGSHLVRGFRPDTPFVLTPDDGWGPLAG